MNILWWMLMAIILLATICGVVVAHYVGFKWGILAELAFAVISVVGAAWYFLHNMRLTG